MLLLALVRELVALTAREVRLSRRQVELTNPAPTPAACGVDLWGP